MRPSIAPEARGPHRRPRAEARPVTAAGRGSGAPRGSDRSPPGARSREPAARGARPAAFLRGWADDDLGRKLEVPEPPVRQCHHRHL